VIAAAIRGYELSGRARKVEPRDFADFDLIVGLDRDHVRTLLNMSPDLESRLKVRLLLDDTDVADPYGGTPREFDAALDLIERGCRELLAELTATPR
jgi:protein-tyrosine phosphatase